MSLPSEMDIVVVHGFWLDELTGLGVKQGNNLPSTIMFDPVPLLGSNATKTPNLRDLTSNAYLKTRTRVATVDPQTGYFAALLVASNDPDLDAYGGRRVTLLGEDPFIIEVPYNAPLTTVDAAMAAKTGLPLNSSVKAIWLTDATVIGNPPPQPPTSYLTSAQTLSTIATAIETHDDDTSAHPDIRALISAVPVISSVVVSNGNLIITLSNGTTFTVALPAGGGVSSAFGTSAFGTAPFGGTP